MPFDGSEYVSRPRRTLDEVRAELIDQLEYIGEQQAAIVVRKIVLGHGCMRDIRRKLRHLDAEACALGKRLSMIDAEIAQRRAA